MYVCVELYEKDTITVGYRWEPYCVLNIRLFKYRKADSLWKKEENEDHNYLYVSFCMEDTECQWSLVDTGYVNVNELLNRYNVFDVRIPSNENMDDYFVGQINKILKSVNNF